METVPSGSFMRNPKDQRATGLQTKIARTAALVCEAARQAALDGVASAVPIATERMPDTPDRVRDIANQVLSRHYHADRDQPLCRGRAQAGSLAIAANRTTARRSKSTYP
jgi:hypothetical protein